MNYPFIRINTNGDKFYYLNGKLHREGAPAVEYADGSKFWYINDNLHREDGPAIEYSEIYIKKLTEKYGFIIPANEWWWLNGKFIHVKSQEEFERYLRLMVFE